MMTNKDWLKSAGIPFQLAIQVPEEGACRPIFFLEGEKKGVLWVHPDNGDTPGQILGEARTLLPWALTPLEPVDGLEQAFTATVKGRLAHVIVDETLFDDEEVFIEDAEGYIRLTPSNLRKAFDLMTKKSQVQFIDFSATATSAQKNKSRKRVLSGIQTSGEMTLGNWLGAIELWKKQIEEYPNCYFFLADLHSLTVTPEPEELRERIRKTATLLLACGLDMERAAMFRQSHLGGVHTELAWLFACITPEGRLEQMTQFKEKAQKQESVGTGLKIYPILMAADIAIYQSHLVPVGDDQRQHLELAREIIRKFNGRYGHTFVVPKALVREGSTARVMDLTDGTKKMSKSSTNKDGCIYLLDSPDDISRKIKRAKTDTIREIYPDSVERPETTNLLGIYQGLTGLSMEAVVAEFEGQGHGALKKALAECLVDKLKPVRERYAQYSSDPAYVEGVLRQGAERVYPVASETLSKAKERVGL
jgi:tryptophanyl-tRNA synthetase